jgi:hypothetical protein
MAKAGTRPLLKKIEVPCQRFLIIANNKFSHPLPDTLHHRARDAGEPENDVVFLPGRGLRPKLAALSLADGKPP